MLTFTCIGSKNDKIWGNIPAYRPTTSRPELPSPATRVTTVTTTAVSRSTTIPVSPSSKSPATTTVRAVTSPPTTKRPDVRKAPAVVVVDEKPDFCNTSFDAVSVIRQDTFFFKGKYTWRLGVKGLYPGYPALIGRLWYELPADMDHVDAVYERQDGKIVFFIG